MKLRILQCAGSFRSICNTRDLVEFTNKMDDSHDFTNIMDNTLLYVLAIDGL